MLFLKMQFSYQGHEIENKIIYFVNYLPIIIRCFGRKNTSKMFSNKVSSKTIPTNTEIVNKVTVLLTATLFIVIIFPKAAIIGIPR